jgi:cysteine desulfurase/selenocysteine lyase
MTTSNEADERQSGRTGAAPRGIDASRTGGPNGLPSDADLSRLANELYATSPGGSQVPTTAAPRGASGAPMQHNALGRESATTLGVSEEQRVHSVLHPHSRGGNVADAAPSHGSGGSAGGIGRSQPVSTTQALRGPTGGNALAQTPTSHGSKSPYGDAALLGSAPAGSAIGLEPGRARTLPFPHSAAPHTPGVPGGTLPSPNSGPQMPGHSRGGFGRPLPSSPDGMLAQSLPGAALTSQAGAPPFVGGPVAATPLAKPLAAMPLDIAALANFSHLEDQRIRALLPPCLARPAGSLGQTPTSGTGMGHANSPSSPMDGGAPYYFLRETPAARAAAAHPSAGLRVPGVEPNRPDTMGAGRRVFDIAAIRRDFPILQERVNGKPIVWLDNAATTQKPSAVIARLVHFYEHENSNIHRAAHELAARATDAYEEARQTVTRFINASDASEIVFVRGATEAINLVAQSWGRQNVGAGDEILITHLEHHANIVPWQLLAAEKGAKLRVAPVDDSGQVRLDEFQRLLNRRTRIVAFPQVSNALGTVTPAREMVEIAHRYGAKVLVDGAQSIAHMPTDVQSLDADWFAFSGHKIFGPTGIGVLYGKQDLLNATLPWQGGGNMIQDVTFEKSSYQPAPGRFEAGTGNIADAAGLGAALAYLESIGMHNVNRYEHELLAYGTEALRRIDGLTLIGTAAEKASVLSFVLHGHSNEEVGKALNGYGIAVRAGHHCAQPILRRFGLESTVRPSLALYNTPDEIDALVDALWHIQSGRT